MLFLGGVGSVACLGLFEAVDGEASSGSESESVSKERGLGLPEGARHFGRASPSGDSRAEAQRRQGVFDLGMGVGRGHALIHAFLGWGDQ
jgi:hypothetical protein